MCVDLFYTQDAGKHFMLYVSIVMFYGCQSFWDKDVWVAILE